MTSELIDRAASHFEAAFPDPAPQDKIVVALQYWAGDRDKALGLARLLAKLERSPREDVIFLIVHRRGADAPDAETLELVAKTFPNVLVHAGVRTGEGHPDGCNTLWVETVTVLGKLARNAKYAFTTEADVVPIRRDWVNVIKAEAAELSERGKLVSGFWQPGGDPKKRQMEHINGNMLVSTNITREVPQVYMVPPGWAWDLWLAVHFKPKWKKGDWIYNGYVGGPRKKESDSPNVRPTWADDEFVDLQDRGYALVHGVRDDSGENFLEKIVDSLTDES